MRRWGYPRRTGISRPKSASSVSPSLRPKRGDISSALVVGGSALPLHHPQRPATLPLLPFAGCSTRTLPNAALRSASGWVAGSCFGRRMPKRSAVHTNSVSTAHLQVGGKLGGGLRGGDLAEPENAPPPPEVRTLPEPPSTSLCSPPTARVCVCALARWHTRPRCTPQVKFGEDNE